MVGELYPCKICDTATGKSWKDPMSVDQLICDNCLFEIFKAVMCQYSCLSTEDLQKKLHEVYKESEERLKNVTYSINKDR